MKNWNEIKSRIWEILEPAINNDIPSKVFDCFILMLISLNVLAVIFGTVPSIQEHYSRFLAGFETISVLIFTVEYVLRLVTCTTDQRFKKKATGRLRFSTRPMSIIDLLAIIPFYLPFVGIDLRALRVFRMMRIFRMLKAARYISSLELIKNVFHDKREELSMTFFIMLFLLVTSATALYYCEHPAQPGKFSSIPATMWWSIATLTTVGYGDIYPITTIGKFCASIIAILGIGLFALPTGILGSGFVEHTQKKKRTRSCPHCGKEI